MSDEYSRLNLLYVIDLLSSLASCIQKCRKYRKQETEEVHEQWFGLWNDVKFSRDCLAYEERFVHSSLVPMNFTLHSNGSLHSPELNRKSTFQISHHKKYVSRRGDRYVNSLIQSSHLVYLYVYQNIKSYPINAYNYGLSLKIINKNLLLQFIALDYIVWI
jgi:hypothetical protein